MSTILLLLALTPGQAREAPRVEERRPDRVLEWNEHALESVRRAKTPPPVAARNLAVVHAAVYDAANTVYRGSHKAYLVDLRATDADLDPHVAVAAAAHRALVAIYPAQKQRLDGHFDRYLATVPQGQARTRSVGLGRYVADRILEARKDDLIARPSGYRFTSDVGLWRPTADDQQPLLPSWGRTKPFGVKSVTAFRLPRPPELNGEEYADDFNEVKAVGGRRSKSRTAEQSVIAWFWNDGADTCTPPGHWNQIAREVSLSKGLQLDENARLFALLNLALADAAISCWEAKYRFDLWRPVTAIREADRDGNDATARDARWEPLLPTPPFPSYTSGHSTFSGAAAYVLAEVLGGDRVRFTVGSDGYPGLKRTFESFSDASREAGLSRIYGGIHYECDNREGRRLGEAVAAEILRTRLLPEADAPKGKAIEARRGR